MKRFISLFLAIVMCCSAVLALTACDEGHTHSYGEWETVLESVCNKTGLRMRRCSCNNAEAEEIPATGTHSFGEWEIALEATCSAKGMRLRHCQCGEYEIEEIAATGAHDFDKNGKCTVCEHSHTFGEWEIVTAATCNAKGLRRRSCTCGTSETAEIAITNTHTYDKDGVCGVCGDDTNGVKIDQNGVRWKRDEWGVWREYDNLPDSLDYDDTISFLYWTGSSSARPEFVQSKEVDDPRLSSIYKRNKEIENRLGVELRFIPEPGDSSNREVFIARLQRAKDAGTCDFDLIGSYAPVAGALLMAGLVQNLTAIEDSYIELSKPWWPDGLIQNMLIGDNLYFLSGDCSTAVMEQMYCMTFNKDLVNEKYELDAQAYFAAIPHVKTPATGVDGGDTATNMIYEKVYAGKWTLDDFLYLASDTYIDKKGDGTTVDDVFGFCADEDALTAFYGSSGLRQIEATTDGSILKISDDWTSTKTVRLIAKLHTLFGTTSFSTYNKPFYDGHAYFSLHYMYDQADLLSSNDKVESFGVLPTPKYDLNQGDYYTVIGNEFSIYSIFIDCDKRGDRAGTLSMLTAVLECWGSEAYRKTTPVIFERSLKQALSPTQYDADMCEMIRASVTLDHGRILQAPLSGSVNGSFSMDGQMVTAAMNGIPWVSQYAPHLATIEGNLEVFVNALKRTMIDVK